MSIETPVTATVLDELCARAAIVAGRVFAAEGWIYGGIAQDGFVPDAECIASNLHHLAECAFIEAKKGEGDGLCRSGRLEAWVDGDGDITLTITLASTCNGTVWREK